jgi:hypothetical protein
VRRIVDDFDRASEVPAAVITALKEVGIDPAARRNTSIIGRMLRMPTSLVVSTPEWSVLNTVENAKTLNQHMSGCPIAAPSGKRAEKRRMVVRKRIRAALATVSPDRKLLELVAVLEEEMYSEWGQVDPVILTITPRRCELSPNSILAEQFAGWTSDVTHRKPK